MRSLELERNPERVPADPWTDPDPQPGDFDAELRRLDVRHLDHLPGSTEAQLRIIADSEDGEHTRRPSGERRQTKTSDE